MATKYSRRDYETVADILGATHASYATQREFEIVFAADNPAFDAYQFRLAVRYARTQRVDCHNCGGTGYSDFPDRQRPDAICPACQGTGREH